MLPSFCCAPGVRANAFSGEAPSGDGEVHIAEEECRALWIEAMHNVVKGNGERLLRRFAS